jgi:hypothetical protein
MVMNEGLGGPRDENIVLAGIWLLTSFHSDLYGYQFLTELMQGVLDLSQLIDSRFSMAAGIML